MRVAVVRGVAGHGVVVIAWVVIGHVGCRRVLCQLLDLLRVETGNFLQAIAHELTQIGARNLFDQRCSQCSHVRLAFQRPRVRLVAQLLEEVVRQRLGVLVDAGHESVGAFGADQAIRVFALGQEQEARPAPILQAGQCGLQGAPGSLATSLVTVEAEQDTRHHAKQALEMFLAGCGAEGCHRVAQALLGQGDDVHIALDHDDLIEVAVVLSRFEQAVEFLAFVKDRGFRGVQVLGLVIAQDPAAKGDDPPRLSRIGNITRSRKRS